MDDHTGGEGRKSRRNLLAKIGGLVAVGGATIGTVSAENGCGIPSDTGNYSEVDHETEITDNNYVEQTAGTEDRAQEIRSSLVYIQSETNPHDHWEHYFVAGSHIITKSKAPNTPKSYYQKDGLINDHSMKIDNQEPTKASIMSTDNPYAGHIGGYPTDSQPPTNVNYGFGAYTAIASALAIAASSTYLSVATTAISAISGLEAQDKGGTSTTYQSYDWSYDFELPCESVHFCEFSLESGDYRSSASFEVTFNGPHWLYSNPSEVQIWQSVDADPCYAPCPSGKMVNGTNPEPGTQMYSDYLENSQFAKRIGPEDSMNPNADDMDKPIYVSRNPLVRGGTK